MIDIKLIRENPEKIREAMKVLNSDAPVEEILRLDERRRELLKENEDLQHRRNTLSKLVSKEKDPAKREEIIQEVRGINEKIKEISEPLKKTEEELDNLLLWVPNLPLPSVPFGKDDSENVMERQWGEAGKFDFNPLPHWEIGEKLGIIDFERGVKLSGTRFYVLKGLGARLQRALITWMLDFHIRNHGYTEIYPPAMVKRECLVGTGNLPKFGENLYVDTEDAMWLIPTAEVPVTNLYREEILPPGSLPIYHVAYSPCFRREKMSAGKETRGIKRGHQFDKVEMVKFVEPEKSVAEHLRLLNDAEEILQALKIPYRVVQMCTGDLSFTACAKFDLEAWASGCGEWLEVSSCSNFWDFQARRANIRFRRTAKAKPEFVHTINGSGLALPRTMIAIIENYQAEDGTISIPEVLIPYMGGIERIGE